MKPAAEHDQQTPVIVVSAKSSPEAYIVIDGLERIAALQRKSPTISDKQAS